MKLRMIAIAGICMAGLAGCGSAAITSAPTTSATSHPAVASPPSATTVATPVTSPTPLAPTTTPAAPVTSSAALVPPTPGTATIATLWCGAVFGVINAPSLSVWETGAYGYDGAFVTTIPNIKASVADIENPSTSAAAEIVLSQSLCGEVLNAEEVPPPVDQSTYASAMSDFLKASLILRAAGGYPAGGRARTDLNSGMTELNAFLTAIGK